MNRRLIVAVAGAVTLLAVVKGLRAGEIAIPNGSFESPATVFVNTHIDSWQKTPKPDWYDESGGFLWSQLTGIFKNTPVGNSDHLDNCDGDQAIWLFAVPQVGLFQDFNSTDWSHPTPTHNFNAKFELGTAYDLTVGINGGGGGMFEGVTMEISLYYLDDASNHVTVAVTSIANSPANFPNHTHLSDYQVHVPFVKAGDAWAGKNIGVQLLSTVSTNLQGGYWDVDNVRLSATSEPALRELAQTNGRFQFALQSEPGLKFEILSSADIATPLSNWTIVETVTNLGNAVVFIDASTNFSQRFYRARQLP